MAEVWRAESARLVATLMRMTHDLGLAEEFAQDALVAALEQWPKDGLPSRPAAWLSAVARRRAVDYFRRVETSRRTSEAARHQLAEADAPDLADAVDQIEDDVLRLMFLTCHPTLAPDTRAVLTLRLVGGLTVPEIARAFLAKEAAVGQRISRAKRTLQESGATLESPQGRERQDRIADVMAVVSLIFNEGYTATAGEGWFRPDLCREAIRLARMLAEQAPHEPEAHGLQALLELQASRMPARRDEHGRAVLLESQDRSKWDHDLIQRGLAALDRAERLGRPVGPYVIQASIAACHAHRRSFAETDWTRIAQLYDVLTTIRPSPVVDVNRAVAYGRAWGPDAGLRILSALDREGTLAARLS
ncbi:RNA polymerase sigma factor [Nocardioides antri]|uniref:RNA polymerase sigma factor n=1 Tax=Nocardioides antri TaxID=2607659 RepID=UPI001FE67D3C|nr:sigma-70 family RNA polymerase sigma factor [Nocardioides antri]